jgi:tRNA G18 (ribose-2'-O)-methylase SpoU
MAKNKKELSIIAHNIRSRHNVGSIFRIADSLGVSKIYLTGYTPRPPHEKIAKVALGAENFVPWEFARSPVILIKKLKKDNPKLSIVGLENNINSSKLIFLNKFKPKFPIALIIGEETKGIEKKLINLCDKLVEIPMQGQKESLNVSVALGIAVYQILKD